MSRDRVAILALVAWAACAAPLAVTDIPPLVDLPNHVARYHILANWHESQELQLFYSPRWRLLPNLGADVLAVTLARVMPAPTATRLVLALAFALLIGGGACLNRQLVGGWSPTALLPSLAVHNVVLAYGLLNYLLAIGLMLCSGAVYLGLRRRTAAVRLVVGVPLTLLLFLCHLVPTVLAGLTLTASEFCAAHRRGRIGIALPHLVVIAGQFTLPVILYLTVSPTAHAPLAPHWQGPWLKLLALAGALVTGNLFLDALYTVVVVALVVAGLALGRLILVPAARPAVVCMTMVFLAAPSMLHGVYNVDMRIPPALLLVATAGLALRRDDRVARGIVAALAVVFMLRMAYVTWDWRSGAGRYRAIRAEMADLPPKALLFSALRIGRGNPLKGAWNPPMIHAPCLAVLDRPRFISSIFAFSPQQPLAFRDEVSKLQMLVTVPEREAQPTALHWAAVMIRTRLDTLPGLAGRPAYLVYIKSPDEDVRQYGLRVITDREDFAILAVPGAGFRQQEGDSQPEMQW